MAARGQKRAGVVPATHVAMVSEPHVDILVRRWGLIITFLRAGAAGLMVEPECTTALHNVYHGEQKVLISERHSRFLSTGSCRIPRRGTGRTESFFRPLWQPPRRLRTMPACVAALAPKRKTAAAQLGRRPVRRRWGMQAYSISGYVAGSISQIQVAYSKVFPAAI
jgi:hypothetical protein